MTPVQSAALPPRIPVIAIDPGEVIVRTVASADAANADIESSRQSSTTERTNFIHMVFEKMRIDASIYEKLEACLKSSRANAKKQPLAPLLTFLEELKKNTDLQGYICGNEEMKSKINKKLYQVVKEVLENSKDIKTFNDSYSVLELADSLQFFNEEDSVSMHGLILNAVCRLLENKHQPSELILFALRLFEEATKWGPLTSEFKTCKKNFLPKLYEFMLTQLPLLNDDKRTIIGEYLCAIPEDLLQTTENRTLYLSACSKHIEKFTEIKVLACITNRLVLFIKSNVLNYQNTASCINMIELAWTTCAKTYSASAALPIFKEKYIEVCILFFNRANHVKDGNALYLSGLFIENKLLAFVSPKDIDLISEMIKIVSALCGMKSNKKCSELGNKLKKAFNTHTAMLCFMTKKTIKYASKAIKEFATSATFDVQRFRFILETLKDKAELQEVIEKSILEKRFFDIKIPPGGDHDMFTECCLEFIRQPSAGPLASTCLKWLEKMSGHLLQKFSAKSFSEKIKFMKHPGQDIERKMLLGLIKAYLAVGNKGQFDKAIALVLGENDDSKAHSFILAQPVVETFFELSEAGNSAGLNQLIKRLPPAFEKCLNLSKEQIFRPKLVSHFEQVRDFKGHSPEELILLFQETEKLLPLYAAFYPLTGRDVIDELMEHFTRWPFALCTAMGKTLEIADICGLLECHLYSEKFLLMKQVYECLSKQEDEKLQDRDMCMSLEALNRLVKATNFADSNQNEFVARIILDNSLPIIFAQCLKNPKSLCYEPYMQVVRTYYEKCPNILEAVALLAGLMMRCTRLPAIFQTCMMSINDRVKPKEGTLLETVKNETTNNPSAVEFTTTIDKLFFQHFLPCLKYWNNQAELEACLLNSTDWLQRPLSDLRQILLFDQKIVLELKKISPQQLKEWKDKKSVYGFIRRLYSFILTNLTQEYSPAFVKNFQDYFDNSPVGIAFNALTKAPPSAT